MRIDDTQTVTDPNHNGGDNTQPAKSTRKSRVQRVSDKGGKAAKQPDTKASVILKKLRTSKGATIAALAEATGWQAHSVRGFLSGNLKKKLGLIVVSESGKDGVRRYRIEGEAG